MSIPPKASPAGERPLHPWRRTIRYWASRLVTGAVTRAWLRLECEGFERLPGGPAIYCFNHLSWSDPFVLMATLPMRPRLSFFGPKEEDMGVGGRNRLMHWTGATIPYKPGKNDLLEATRKVGAVIGAGGIVAIAGEGRIGAIEAAVLPLNDGPAYFALRSRVPLVPIAINGTSWLRFGGRVRIRVGEPIVGSGRPDRVNVDRDDGRPRGVARGARRRRPAARSQRPLRGVAIRAIQRMARGFPRGGPGRAARRRDRATAAGCGGRLTGRLWHTRPAGSPSGATVAATGLSADPTEYRARLTEQTDEQIDLWAQEMMRDVAKRRGVIRVLDDLRRAARLSERDIERAFASGDGPPAVIGRDAQGRQMMPAVALYALVPGICARTPRTLASVSSTTWSRTSTSSSTSDGPLTRAAAFIRLVHPFPSLLDGVVVAGVAVAAGADPARALGLGVSMTALQVSIGALNDVHDAPDDAGHKPGKPIPAGLVSVPAAWAVVVLGAVLGIALGALADVRVAGLAVVVLLIGYGYDLVAKGTAVVVAAVRAGHPIAAGVRLAGRGRGAPVLLPRPRPDGDPGRRGTRHRERPSGRRAGCRRRAPSRSRPGSASRGRGGSTPRSGR